MFAEHQQADRVVAEVKANVPSLPDPFESDLHEFYPVALREASAAALNADPASMVIRYWYAAHKARNLMALYQAGWVPPSLAAHVDNPNDYVPGLVAMEGWLQPKQDYCEKVLAESNGETPYWRQAPSGATHVPPFDLPRGYAWDEEASYDYWVMRRA